MAVMPGLCRIIATVHKRHHLPPPTGVGCSPHYSDCVPIARDVDCAGGSGDGPAYIQGPVRVLGKDIYRLDPDKDGIACE